MNTIAAFPEKIDDLLFFHDMDIPHAQIFKRYQELLNMDQYEEAALYIQESGIPYYGAALFNLIESMIYAVQNYLLNDNPKCNPHTVSDSEPANAPEDTIWT